MHLVSLLIEVLQGTVSVSSFSRAPVWGLKDIAEEEEFSKEVSTFAPQPLFQLFPLSFTLFPHFLFLTLPLTLSLTLPLSFSLTLLSPSISPSPSLSLSLSLSPSHPLPHSPSPSPSHPLTLSLTLPLTLSSSPTLYHFCTVVSPPSNIKLERQFVDQNTPNTFKAIISWTPPTPLPANMSGYRVYVNDVPKATVATETKVLLSDLPVDVRWYMCTYRLYIVYMCTYRLYIVYMCTYTLYIVYTCTYRLYVVYMCVRM